MSDWRERDTIDVAGVIDQGRFRPLSIAIPDTSAAPAPPLIPLDRDVLTLARHRVFGIEQRVTVTMADGALIVTCAPGVAPAGVVIDWPTYRLPDGYRGRWTITGWGLGFGLSAVAVGADAPAEPQAALSQGSASLPLDTSANQIVLTCPATAAKARIGAITLAPRSALPIIASRGTWVWREADWHRDPVAFVVAAANAGLTEIAVQIPAEPDAALDQLARSLAAHDITPRLVDGDPAMATAAGLPGALRHFAAVRAWCARRCGAARRISLELDIEPYARPDSGRDPAAAWRGWAEAVRAIAKMWGAPIAVDLPWWMYGAPGGREALSLAGDAIGEVVVMAYRTDPHLIVDAAAPWLGDGRWPVRVAIETGVVAREAVRHYRRADTGTLRIDDGGATLLDAATAADGKAATFALVAEDVTEPARVSFHGAPDRAATVERAIVPILSGWPRFSGWRVHGWTAPHLPSA